MLSTTYSRGYFYSNSFISSASTNISSILNWQISGVYINIDDEIKNLHNILQKLYKNNRGSISDDKELDIFLESFHIAEK